MVERNLPAPRLPVRGWLSGLLVGLLVWGVGCSTTSRSSRKTSALASGVTGLDQAPVPAAVRSQENALADLPPLPPVIEASSPVTGRKNAPAAATTDGRVIPTALAESAPDAAGPGPASAPAGAGAIGLDDSAGGPPAAAPDPAAAPIAAPPIDAAVTPAQCATCGGAGRLAGVGACSTCGGSGLCYPGQQPCYDLPAHTFVGRFLNELYHCLCCPDPCYQPTWVPEANSAFFMDFARPQTLTRFRDDDGRDMQFPDRSEYFFARAGLNRGNMFMGTGPMVPKYHLRNGQPLRGFFSVDWNQLSLYNEIASSRASFFVEIPYRSISMVTKHYAGFSDMNIGTKSLLFDCELLQVAFQFRTYFPIGNVSEGLGNGHFTLEPSFLFSLHVARQTYIQAEITDWIPLTSDPYAGAIFMHHASLNQVVWRFTPDVPLIAMIEYSGWTFQDGAYTNPVTGPVHSAGETYVTVGPSLRLSICKRFDGGVGIAYPVSENHWADPQVRSEFRLIY